MAPPSKAKSRTNESLRLAREKHAADRATAAAADRDKPQQQDEEMPSAGEETSEDRASSSATTPRRSGRNIISDFLFPRRRTTTTPAKRQPGQLAAAQAKSVLAREQNKSNKADKAKHVIDWQKKFREQDPTIRDVAEEAIDDAEAANNLEEDLLDTGESRHTAFENVVRECQVKDQELEEALKELSIISEKQKALLKDKKAATMKFKRELEKHKTANKNMQRKINRRDFYHQQARKPFTELQSRNSRYEAVKRFIGIVTTFFTCYLFIDFFTISRRAWPNINTPLSMLSAAQTWQFMNELNISFTKMRVIKRFMKTCGFNVFASEGNVYQLIEKVANATKSFVKNLQVQGKPTQLKCASIESLKELIKQRVIAQMKGGKFPKGLKNLRLCIGFDKGGTTTKMCLMMGSIKGRNGPRNMSLLALYEGNESPDELKAAFQDIIDECKKLKRIRVGSRTIKVSFRFTGDLKCLKACLGLKGGSPNYPCLYCLQFREKTFGDYSEGAGPVRENYIYNGDESLPGQGHFGCLSWIKPQQIVLPSLHLMMGVAEKIFDSLISRICIKEAITDFNGFDMDAYREKQKNFVAASDELKAERERLNDWEAIKENFQGKALFVPEAQWPEGMDRRAKWSGEICGSSNCISKISDIVLPGRISPSEATKVPDWIQSSNRMWFHSLCLGFSDEEAVIAGQIDAFEPVFKPKEAMLAEIQNEIEKAEEKVRKAQHEVQAQLLKIDMPKAFANHPTVNALFKVFEKFGAYKTAFFQRFTGNHIRALLESAVPEEDGTSKLHKKLVESESLKYFIDENHPKFDEQFKIGMDALHLLAKIQDMFKSDILTEAEIEQLRDDVESLESKMKQLPEVKVGHKFHLLLKHVPSVADRDKTIGFFSEHGIESMHALVNQLMRRLTVRTNETRLERIIQFVNSVAVTRDQYGEIDPLKRKKLEKEDNISATALDMLDGDDEDEYDDDFLFPYDNVDEEDEDEPTEEETITINLAELTLE